jgi:hypothetical protein
MKLIIAGGRDIDDAGLVQLAIEDSGWGASVTEVVSGGAPGIDSAGEAIAALHGIRVQRFPAEWHLHGRAAGPIRNEKMAIYGDRLVAIWDGSSRGTKNMIDQMKKLGKPVFVMYVQRDSDQPPRAIELGPWVKVKSEVL